MRITNTRLKNIYAQATPEEVQHGVDWYRTARNICRVISAESGASFNTTCKIMSVLSPSVQWNKNVLDCKNLLKAYYKDGVRDPHKVTVSTYNQNKYKAFAILNGEADLLPSARKTYAFYRNIASENDDFVTVDRHAIKVLVHPKRLTENHNGGVNLSKSVYEKAEAVYKRTAQELGLRGYELQAIVWLAFKRLKQHG